MYWIMYVKAVFDTKNDFKQKAFCAAECKCQIMKCQWFLSFSPQFITILRQLKHTV